MARTLLILGLRTVSRGWYCNLGLVSMCNTAWFQGWLLPRILGKKFKEERLNDQIRACGPKWGSEADRTSLILSTPKIGRSDQRTATRMLILPHEEPPAKHQQRCVQRPPDEAGACRVAQVFLKH